ncbi:hypothetical protein AYO44_07645 [Planctomycetaceae bacterium SCGC AG-212-F19]|nr:hypothetical protein AYO44_07645 [Planctomycetaceae bacterium SCGC AG-212-F19]
MRRSLLLIPFVALLLAPDAKEDAIAKDKAALKGTWKVASVAYWKDDKKAEEELRDAVIVFSDKTFTSKPGFGKIESNYTIDPSKTPKEIELTSPDESDKKTAMTMLYKIEGDTLIICVSLGESRPKEFKPSEETKTIVITYKRVKP